MPLVADTQSQILANPEPADSKLSETLPIAARFILRRRSREQAAAVDPAVSSTTALSQPQEQQPQTQHKSGPVTPPPHVANFLTSPSQLSLISSPSTISPRSSRSSASLDPDEEAIFHQLIREHDGLTKENGILREEVERAEEILATTQRQAIENKILYDQAREQTEIVLLDRDKLGRKLYRARKQVASSEFVCSMFAKAYRHAMDKMAAQARAHQAKITALETRCAELEVTCSQLEERKEHMQSLNESQQTCIEALQADLVQRNEDKHELEDKNAELGLLCDDLEDTCTSLEGKIVQMQNRESELEVTLEEAKTGLVDMQNMLTELETAYAELRSTTASQRPVSGITSGAASVPHSDEDEDEDVDIDCTQRYAMPSGRLSPASVLDHFTAMPPYEIQEEDLNDPLRLAEEIYKLEHLVATFNDLLSQLSHDRNEIEERFATLQEREAEYQIRVADYIEIEIDLKNREDEYFAHCERREKEFNDLAREYESWRLSCEVREEEVREDRQCLWRLKDEVSKRERDVRRKERELKWRVKCLGRFEEGCWKCIPESSYTEDEDEECYDDDYESEYDYNEEDEEPVSTNPTEQEYEDMIASKVKDMMKLADEQRRQRQREASKAPAGEEEEDDYDEELANLNDDGLHGLGIFFESPTQLPKPLAPEEEGYDDEEDVVEREEDLSASWDVL